MRHLAASPRLSTYLLNSTIDNVWLPIPRPARCQKRFSPYRKAARCRFYSTARNKKPVAEADAQRREVGRTDDRRDVPLLFPGDDRQSGRSRAAPVRQLPGNGLTDAQAVMYVSPFQADRTLDATCSLRPHLLTSPFPVFAIFALFSLLLTCSLRLRAPARLSVMTLLRRCGILPHRRGYRRTCSTRSSTRLGSVIKGRHPAKNGSRHIAKRQDAASTAKEPRRYPHRSAKHSAAPPD